MNRHRYPYNELCDYALLSSFCRRCLTEVVEWQTSIFPHNKLLGEQLQLQQAHFALNYYLLLSMIWPSYELRSIEAVCSVFCIYWKWVRILFIFQCANKIEYPFNILQLKKKTKNPQKRKKRNQTQHLCIGLLSFTDHFSCHFKAECVSFVVARIGICLFVRAHL